MCCHLQCVETSTHCVLTAEMTSKTRNAEVPLGTEGTQALQILFMCSDEILSCFAFVMQVPHGRTQTQGPEMVCFFTALCALPKMPGASSSFSWQASQQQAVSQPSFPCAPTSSCSHGSISSDLVAPSARFKFSWRASPRPVQSSCSVSHLLGVPVSVRTDPAVAVGSSLPILSSLLPLTLAREPRPPALLSFR